MGGMRLQIATASEQTKRNTSNTSYAFTEQGVAMLSSVLSSQKAIEVNIAIMRTFIKIRQYALNYKELADKLLIHDKQFSSVYEALDYLINKDNEALKEKQHEKIGFKI